MKKVISIILICLFLGGCQLKNYNDLDEVVYIHDNSVFALFTQHSGALVYASVKIDGEWIQLWNMKPRKGFILNHKQLILAAIDVFRLVRDDRVMIEFEDRKIAIVRKKGWLEKLK